jgi:predicted nucleic acid-binding Zn ribbon protein
MGGALDRVVRHLGGPSVDALGALYQQWDELVGPRLSGHTRPLSLRGGTLVIGVTDPAWATQLRFLESTLLERLAGLDGAPVTSIEVRVRPI